MRPAARDVRVGQYPIAMALDSAVRTAYVTAGRPRTASGTLAMVNVATCNAAVSRGCAHVRHIPVGGQFPADVAVDEQTQTVYVSNGALSHTVAVLNAATCNAVTSRGCRKDRALISVPNPAPGGSGPAALAINPRTSTIYVTHARSNQLSVINGKICNAADLRRCQRASTTVSVGSQRYYPTVAVDPVTDTIYLGSWNEGLLVIDGRTCNGTDARGCGKVLATVPVDGWPTDITVDQATGSLYVTGADASAVTVINRNTCSALTVSGCAGHLLAARGGAGPVAAASDQASPTLYVADGESNTVSMIDTSVCSAAAGSGCGQVPASFPAGTGPHAVAVDPGNRTVYVLEGQGLSVISSRACNAAYVRGCPAWSPAGTIPPGAGRNPTYYCDATIAAYDSGEPAGPLIRGSVRVAAGSAGGLGWSLWAKKGIADPYGIEQGGMVLNGRWYGLCSAPLSAGPDAGFEVIDTGGRGVVYGFIQHPYPVTISLSSGRQLPRPASVLLHGTTFFIARLPRSACSYRRMTLHAVASRGPAWSGTGNVTFGSCVPGRLVSTSQGDGTWGPGAGN